jgi:hypothetical protein
MFDVERATNHCAVFFILHLSLIIFLVTRFSKFLGLCFSVSVTDRLSYPRKTSQTGSVFADCFVFVESRRKSKRFRTEL